MAWHSKKQNSQSLSTCEEEYIVAGSCCTQLIWMKQMLADYGVDTGIMKIFCDNSSAIQITENPVEHSRTKHIDIRYHSIRDLYENGIINMEFVPPEQQLADILTKPLDTATFQHLRQSTGVVLVH